MFYKKFLKKTNVRPFSDGETVTVGAVVHHVFFPFGLRLGQLTDQNSTTIYEAVLNIIGPPKRWR